MTIVERKGPESPEILRELARRARFVASHLSDPDKVRINTFADELEKLAAQQTEANRKSG